MRKIIAVILTLALTFTLGSFAVSAQSTETDAAITAAYGTPTIDGDQDDVWMTTVVQDVKLVDTAVIPSDTATTGTVRVLWDANYLYFFITVDKHGEAICSGGGSENTDDCADVCFTMNGNFDGTSNVTGGDEYAGVFRTLEDGSFGGFGDYQTNNIDEFKGVMKRTSDSTYNCEYAIPWVDITPAADYVVSMDIQINVATDDARMGLVNWAYEPCYGWRDSMYHGMVTLLAEVVAEPETEAPVVEEEPVVEEPATVEEPVIAPAPATGDAAILSAVILCAGCAAAFVWSKKR